MEFKDKILQQIEDNDGVFHGLRPKWSPYIPHDPTPKQLAFLMIPHREAFYGGAAGGGKSDALLMGALQYVDVPGYAAMIFRKTLSDLKQPGALLDRAHAWLSNTPAKWNAGEHTYYFPTYDKRGNPAEPAKLTFGYIGQTDAYTRYQGIELQYCAFDELTQHWEDDYLYLFSRIRRNRCPEHGNETDPNCNNCDVRASVPIRMRSASNPGGVGHSWVKDRFDIGPAIDPDNPERQRFIGRHPDRPYIPAYIRDNPFLDQEEYIIGLEQLDPVTREQLKDGDWAISQDSRFKKSWAKYYSMRGGHICLGKDGKGAAHPMQGLQRVFSTIDPAASAREGPGDKDIWRKQPSYTVISTFGLTADYNLVWLDMRRFRKEIPDILQEVRGVYKQWQPQYFICESSGLGKGAFQMIAKCGLPVRSVHPHHDKLVRATDAMNRMQQGKIWLPQTAGWLHDCEKELFSWTAHPHQSDDIIDTLAYAAKDVSWEAAHEERSLVEIYTDDLPGIIM
tara:strand:- start:19667 stop:21187 length:1521 start_codon:yes stop_codon:yes gene_type:complete